LFSLLRITAEKQASNAAKHRDFSAATPEKSLFDSIDHEKERAGEPAVRRCHDRCPG
jgi:hypothetical protein